MCIVYVIYIMHILGSMKCVLFQFDIITNTLLIMAQLKQTYYNGSCFVSSYVIAFTVTIEKKLPHSLQKGPIKFQ